MRNYMDKSNSHIISAMNIRVAITNGEHKQAEVAYLYNGSYLRSQGCGFESLLK